MLSCVQAEMMARIAGGRFAFHRRTLLIRRKLSLVSQVLLKLRGDLYFHLESGVELSSDLRLQCPAAMRTRVIVTIHFRLLCFYFTINKNTYI